MTHVPAQENAPETGRETATETPAQTATEASAETTAETTAETGTRVDFGLDQTPDSDMPTAGQDVESDPAAIPDTPDDYVISLDDAFGAVDADLNQRLHAAGFSNAQAQLVYDLAGEILSPMLSEMDQAAARATDRATLVAEFGGAESWKVLAPKIESWGKANLPDAAFDTLCQTADGVRAMHRMMAQNDEAALGKPDGGAGEAGLRSEIRRKMNDPRYWRDRDPALVAEVQADFARLSDA